MKSLKVQTFQGLFIIFCLTAILVVYFGIREIGPSLIESEEKSVRNIFQLVHLNVTATYKQLLNDKVAAIEQRKQRLYSSSRLAIATFGQLNNSGLSQAQAKQIALEWIAQSRVGQSESWRIIDRQGRYLSHPETQFIGTSAFDIKDLLGRPVTENISTGRSGRDSEFAVFMDPLKNNKKLLGFFHRFSVWDWTLVNVVDLSDIEFATNQKQRQAMEGLQTSFDQIRLPGNGSAFIFNSQRQNLINPQRDFSEAYLSQLVPLKEQIIQRINLLSAVSDTHPFVLIEGKQSAVPDLKVYASYFQAFDSYTAVAIPKAALTRPANRLLLRQGLLVSVIFLFGLLIAFVFVHKTSAPLLQLAATMRKVSQTDDYALRYHAANNVEVGQLVDGFNDMLTQIEVRDLELKEHRENLEHTVSERTAELNETITSLEIAKKDAETANRAKSNFLAIMTHELRTPLIGVLGMNELLLNTHLSEEQRELAVTAQNSGEILMTLINDILDFSKIESKTLTLHPVPTDISQIAEETTKLLDEAARKKGLALTSQISPEAHQTVMADPLKVRQVLLNLINNAIKFTHQGEITIRLDMSTRGDNEGLYTIEIQDTGVGINTEDQRDIFEPFTQIDTESGRNASGTGLGLAIVKQLVELMGGELEVESRPGEGSLFRVQLTLQLAENQRNKSTSIEPSACSLLEGKDAATEHTPGQSRRILIVDDNVVTRDLVRHHLGPLGLKIDEAASGQVALEMAMNKTYGLVLMDYNMPGMDGVEATRQLRERGNTVPVVALTAHVDKQVLSDCSDVGMNDCLPKPFRGAALKEMVNKWLMGDK